MHMHLPVRANGRLVRFEVLLLSTIMSLHEAGVAKVLMANVCGIKHVQIHVHAHVSQQQKARSC